MSDDPSCRITRGRIIRVPLYRHFAVFTQRWLGRMVRRAGLKILRAREPWFKSHLCHFVGFDGDFLLIYLVFAEIHLQIAVNVGKSP